MTERMVTVTSAGCDSGTRTRRKNPNRLQPSIAAASSSSAGIARMNGRRMMIVIGIAERRLRQRDAEQRLEQAELAQQEVERQRGDGDREEQPEREEGEERLAPPELACGRAGRRPWR